MRHTELPSGLVARPMSADDTRAVTALIAASEEATIGFVEIDFDDIAMNFGRPGFDSATDSLVVFDGPALVAWADVYRERAEVDVHPSHYEQGIGAALLEWIERRANELRTPRLRQIIPDANERAASLLARRGYSPGHTSWVLLIDLDGELQPVPPDKITIRMYDPARDAPAVYRLIEDAFNEWEGREPQTFDEWAALSIAHGSFAPAISPLAFDGDQLVGAALSLNYDGLDDGWIHHVATRATHRDRGIARALLRTAFAAFRDRGKLRCGLSTDSRAGALSLYERVGMRVTRSYTNHVKQLRRG